MANITLSASQTIAAMFQTVGGAANATTKIVDSMSSSVDMLDHYVQRAKEKQIFQAAAEDEIWKRRILRDVGFEQAREERDLEKKLSSDARLAELYFENEARLLAKFLPAQQP